MLFIVPFVTDLDMTGDRSKYVAFVQLVYTTRISCLLKLS